ncbi:MAG: multidrug ABC transporter ATPase [Gammaproteobacteria bacterium]|nr:multidrug ABC transporter ATPase [Gammaproteobacteria bacterium]
MTDQVITFSGVHKRYGRQQVLCGIDLIVPRGQFLGLVGVNGAGKTTMIKCLLDFTSLDSGSIRIRGQDSSITEARNDLAYLPEKFTPPYYLTGRDFLEYMSRLHQAVFQQEQIESMLGILDLDLAALTKPVRQLSKGMSQKLGLAACLLSDKELLIMDEPMSGLDPRSRAYLKQYLLGLKARNKTLFFSTHLLNDVEVLCDQVAVLHQGQIRFTGSPAECCKQFETDDFEQAYLKCINSGKE